MRIPREGFFIISIDKHSSTLTAKPKNSLNLNQESSKKFRENVYSSIGEIKEDLAEFVLRNLNLYREIRFKALYSTSDGFNHVRQIIVPSAKNLVSERLISLFWDF